MLDAGAVLNILSTNLARALKLACLSLKKTITVADGTMETCHGTKNIPAIFGELKTKMDFMVVGGVPVGMLTGNLEMEKLNACIDLACQYNNLSIGKKAVQIELKPDWTIDQMSRSMKNLRQIPVLRCP